jgi:hypothetical protein
MSDRPGWGTEPIEAAMLKYPPLVSHGLMGPPRANTARA